MRLTALVIAVFLTASAAEAVDRKNLPGRDVTICMPQINDSRVREATRIATRIFDDIGVRLEWKLPAECPVAEDAIRVSFSRGNPNQPANRVLAYAFPFEGSRIVILPDRINAITSHRRFHLTLAYVLVHEITHVLQGISRHSREGIMKAQWTDSDYYQMINLRLSFTNDDIDRLYGGLNSRFAKAQKAASAVGGKSGARLTEMLYPGIMN